MELLTIDEASAYIRVSTRTLRRWMSDGHFDRSIVVKIGRRQLVKKEDLNLFIEKNKENQHE